MGSSRYFDSKYDVICIGAALAGLSTALELAKAGKKVLMLERHNLPGGVATSYSRGGVEFEASLHEMMSIGEPEAPLAVRKFLEGHDIHVDWVRVPEAFHYVDEDTDVTIRSSYNGDICIPARDIAQACGEWEEGPLYKKIYDFLTLCQKVDFSCQDVQSHDRNIAYIAIHHKELAATAGYSSLEVMKAYDLPKKAIDILSAYWIYLGSPASDLPFTVYAVVLDQYFTFGSYIPRHTSFEMAIKMAERAREMGVQIEYGQRVDKILLSDEGVAYGVRTASGEEIHADTIVCGAYPNTVYTHMLEEGAKIPPVATKAARARKIGVSCFSVVMLLDKPAEELGIHSYATFLYTGKGRDDQAYADGKSEGPYSYMACVCPNILLDDASPKGTCVYSITYLPDGEAFANVNEDNYAEISRKNASFFIEKASKMLGVDLFDHIKEITLETPVSVAHYTGAYLGTIYGYSHSMGATVVARIMKPKLEATIPGLYFVGAHHLDGDGMAPVISSGIHTAAAILEKEGKR